MPGGRPSSQTRPRPPARRSAYRRLTVSAVQACNRRLVATGIDLGAYNTTENAADFADLRVALGIPEWNVFGDSYGTNLAMTLMRQHPQGIRTVTIDSVEPPEVVTADSFAPNAREGFDRLFRACMAQPQCWPRHPGIAQTFTKLVRRLEAHPVVAWVMPPTGGSAVKVVLDGGALVNWLIERPSTPLTTAIFRLGSPSSPTGTRAISPAGMRRRSWVRPRGLSATGWPSAWGAPSGSPTAGLDPVDRSARVPRLSGLGAQAGPARNVPARRLPRLEGSEGARGTAGGNAEPIRA